VVAAIVPIFKGDEEKAKVQSFIDKLVGQLVGQGEADRRRRTGDGVESCFFDPDTHQRLVVDWRDARPGDKQYHWEQRGVPFRIEVGPRDVDGGAFILKRRLDRGRETIPLSQAHAEWLRGNLQKAHQAMFDRALQTRQEMTREAESYDQMKQILCEKGGFVRCYFQPNIQNEAMIKDQTKATVRCIPFDQPASEGRDIFTGQPTRTQVLFALAY
jgi:prolyl-tRNA synthetase